MPNIWTNCVKIHENCGGVFRWVEAIDRPSVGYTGECTYCGDTNIPTEHMIPLEYPGHKQMLQVAPCETTEEMVWNEDKSWEQNQKRLGTTVAMLFATEGIDHETPDHVKANRPD